MTGIGLCLPQLGPHVTLEAVRDFAISAEELGYGSLWVQDHFLYPVEPRRGYAGRPGLPVPEEYRSVLAPTELLTAAAAWTTRPLLGTSVLVAGNHWPAPLAQRLATIDVLSGGRLVVGLGVGWNAEEHDASGSDITTRGARIDDFVPALLACWSDDPVEYSGPFFQIPTAVMQPKPLQRPHPPLLTGIGTPAGMERMRQHYQGWNPTGPSVDEVAATATETNGRRSAGMSPLQIHYRAFFQRPLVPEAQPLDTLLEEARAAANHGFDQYIVEHNFWNGIESPADWAAVPERFAALVEAVR